MDLLNINRTMLNEFAGIDFGHPVKYVYNPLVYASEPAQRYLKKYGRSPREIVLVGMNPGPWGMAQTGVPFGEVSTVRDWMGISGYVGKPEVEHPKRPVTGFDCTRSEVSGRRLWGWARERYGSAEKFFERFFVANYCPLIFFENAGRNITPDKLPAHIKKELFDVCDSALERTVRYIKPSHVIGIGAFAHGRCVESLSSLDVQTGRVSHPSPANPAANRGWTDLMEKELSDVGIEL
ncbi:MAG: uracil-DNA glycosylase family protein [bacterium]